MSDTARSTPAFALGGPGSAVDQTLIQLAVWLANEIIAREMDFMDTNLPAAFRPYLAQRLTEDPFFGYPDVATADTYLRETWAWDDDEMRT